MMTSRIIILLVACSVLLSPVLGVGHLFVDEITGYTNEDVGATNVHTGILVVDEQTVTNGVSAVGGSNSHVVDTSGKIFLNAGSLDFTASDSIEITSLGESVGFEGSTVSFSAGNDIDFDGVDISFVGYDSITGNVGGTFGTYGTDAELRSVFDMTLAARDNFFLDSAERVRLVSNEFSVRGNSVSVSSAESNLFVESLLHLSVNADNVARFTADSGLEVGSSHGDASLSATTEITVQAENFIYTTETNTFSVADTLTLTTQSVAGDIFMYTERTLIDVPEGSMTMESTGINSQTAVITSGTIEGTSNTFTASAADILLVSVDATTFTSRTDFSMDVTNDINFLAAGGMTYEASNVLVESTDAAVNLDAFGKSYFNAISADLLINAGTDFTFTTGSTSISAANSMEINADDLNVTGDFIDFYSAKDILVTGTSLAVTAETGAMDSHENSVYRAQNIDFTAATFIDVVSSGDVVFQNSNDFNVEGDSILYDIRKEAIFSSFDTQFVTVDNGGALVDMNAFKGHFSSGGAIDIDTSMQYTTVSRDSLISANNNIELNIAGEILFATATLLADFSVNAFSVDIDAGELSVFNTGNSVFTADSINVAADSLTAIGDSVVISAVDGVNFSGADTVLWNAPSIFIYLPTVLAADTTLDITGTAGIHLGASFNHGDTFSIEAPSLIDRHNAVSLNGGSVDVNVEGPTTFGVNDPDSPIINFAVDGEKDFILSANNGDMTFAAENSAILNGSFLEIETDSIFRLESQFNTVITSDEFTINASDDIDFEVFGQSAFFQFIDSTIHSDGTLILSNGDASDFDSEILIDIGSRDILEFNTLEFNAVTRDIHIYADEWSNTGGDDLSILSGDAFEWFFADINLSGFEFDMSGDTLESFAKVSSSISSSDINVITDNLEVLGGSITLTTEAFSLDTQSFIVGNTASTPANLNFENTVLDFDNEFSISAAGQAVTIIATGSEAFEQEGIRMVATELNIDATNLSVEAYRGVVINAPVFTSTSSDVTQFTATRGAMISYAKESDISYTATSDNIAFDSSAGITFQGFSAIDSNSASSIITAAKEINMLSHDNNIEFSATTLLDLSGEAFTLTAGLEEGAQTSDITFTVGGNSVYEFDTYARIQALGDQTPGQTRRQIRIAGADALGRLSGVKQVSFYPSGKFSLSAETASTLTATAGSLSFGSESNLMSFDSVLGPMSYTSAGDFSVNAGGVFGGIDVDIDSAFNLLTTGTISSSANGTVALFADFYQATAAVDITYLAMNDKAKIHAIVSDIAFNTQDNNINIIGKNSEIIAVSSILTLGSAITLGTGTPQISTNATNVLMDSLGDINIGSSGNLIRYHANEQTDLLSENTFMSSGEDFIVTADTLLGIESDSITMTAENAVYISVGNGLISHDPITLQSTGIASGNGMVISSTQQTGATRFLAGNGLFHTIEDTYSMNAVTAFGDLEQLTSISDTLVMDVDSLLTFRNGVTLALLTTGNTAKMSFLTEGFGSNIDIEVNTDVNISSGSNVNYIATGLADFVTSQDFTMTTSGANSGKINLDSTGDITVFSARGDNIFNIVNDLDISATGEESQLHLNAQSHQITSQTTTFSTDAGEGGSVIIESESQSTEISFSQNTWLADVDGDFNINTRGYFTFGSSDGEFDLAAFGYAHLGSLEDFLITSTSGVGDLFLEAENAYVHFEGYSVLAVSAGEFTANSDTLNVVTNGNATATGTDSFIGFSSGEDLEFTELDGNIMITSYSLLSVDSDDYIRIEGSATSGNAVTVTTTHAGGDFTVESDSAFMIAEDITLTATGTIPESGYVRIIAARDVTYDPLYWDGANISPDVIISSAQETSVKSETGDIKFEYSSQLLIDGGAVNAFIGGAMEVNVRGDGRSITETVYDYELSPAAVSIHDVSGVQFITESGGQVTFQSGAGDVRMSSVVTTIRSDTGNLYLESSGTVSFLEGLGTIFDDDDLINFGAGTDITSSNSVFVSAVDANVEIVTVDAYFANPNINGAVNWIAEENSLLQVISLRDIDIFGQEVSFSTTNLGDINIGTSFSQGTVRIDIDDDIDIISGGDLYLQYTDTFLLFADDNVTFTTNFLGNVPISETFTDSSNFIRLNGYSPLIENDAEQAIRPIVAFPDHIRFNDAGTNIHVSQGTWCEVNRQLGFGNSNQGAPYNVGPDESIFCVCVDHVWACIYDEPTGGYTYDPFNNR